MQPIDHRSTLGHPSRFCRATRLAMLTLVCSICSASCVSAQTSGDPTGYRTFAAGPIVLLLPATRPEPTSPVQPIARHHLVATVQHLQPMGVAPTHRVIRPPQPVAPSDETSHPHLPHSERAKAWVDQHEATHPPHGFVRQRRQAQPAMIPDATQQDTWKAPYSYGYFGAAGERHWSLHHGYRDRHTEWTRR